MNGYRFHVLEEKPLLRHRAAGDQKRGDTLLSNVLVVNVFTSEILPSNILIDRGMIVGVGKEYNEAEEIYDLGFSYVLPGLIDGHIHVESSMVTVPRLAEALLPLGTTTIIADPHEITSVLGMRGVDYILRSSENIPLNLFITAPSFHPLSSLETSGASLSPEEVEELLRLQRVVGLGEVMDFAGLVDGNPNLWRKVEAAHEAGKPVDGHAPKLTGRILDRYISAGIASDHESTTPQEALERLRGGMMLMIREGSAARNMESLIGAVGPTNAHRCLLVSDDRLPVDLLREGHMDHLIRRAMALGLSPITTIKMATINAALHFRLPRLGAVAPGYAANLIVVDDLENFRVNTVFKDGKLAARDGELLMEIDEGPPIGDPGRINLPPLSRERLAVNVESGRARAIRINPKEIANTGIIVELGRGRGAGGPDPERDLLKLAVVERHKGTGNVGLGIVKGFGLKRGAIASSVAHDCHNIIAVGADDGDILCAVHDVARMEGGLAVAAGGRILESLPLPIAGLMSKEPLPVVARKLSAMNRVVRELGSELSLPFTTLSFLSLPVIPELRVTDKGLVDVAAQRILPLEA